MPLDTIELPNPSARLGYPFEDPGPDRDAGKRRPPFLGFGIESA